MSTLRAQRDHLDDDVLTGDAFTSTRIADYLPGIALLIAVGFLGKYTEVWWLALGDVLKLGATSLVQILVDMAASGAIILSAARFFGLSGKLGSLLAIGTSICGVSAIVASKGAVRAPNSDVGYAIAAILALGTVALFTLPPLGHALGLTDHEFGLWRVSPSTTPPRRPRRAICSPRKRERLRYW
jgi:uncharacterized membrane protein YadS